VVMELEYTPHSAQGSVLVQLHDTASHVTDDASLQHAENTDDVRRRIEKRERGRSESPRKKKADGTWCFSGWIPPSAAIHLCPGSSGTGSARSNPSCGMEREALVVLLSSALHFHGGVAVTRPRLFDQREERALW
jgi:hypothetical protein